MGVTRPHTPEQPARWHRDGLSRLLSGQVIYKPCAALAGGLMTCLTSTVTVRPSLLST